MLTSQELKAFATDRQIEILDAFDKYGSHRKTATALGLSKSAVSETLARVRRKAMMHSYDAGDGITVKIDEPYIVKGTSQFYQKGVLKHGWVKTQLDERKHKEIIKAAYEAMAEELPRLSPIQKPALGHDQLCNLYTFTDSHVGMLANKLEGGENWDLKIAEATLIGIFEQMIMSTPMAKTGFVNQLGDFLHSDGMMPVTPTSGHIVDQDGRFFKMVNVAIRVLRKIIDMALMRHEEVIVLIAEGNHDLASSIWLRAMFKALYENEPRIKVLESELPYYQYQHGKIMLAFHHGHLSKNDSLPLLFAAQFPKVWGDTTKRYCHTGHRHHVEEKEHSGMKVIQHSTLAARDAYAARGGWISDREATAITYHSQFGQVARTTVTPEMLT